MKHFKCPTHIAFLQNTYQMNVKLFQLSTKVATCPNPIFYMIKLQKHWKYKKIVLHLNY